MEEVGGSSRCNSCNPGLWADATEGRQVYTSALGQLGLHHYTCTGIDPGSGAPSKFALLRLAAKSEFREGVARVTAEMKKAGVDLTSPVRWAVRVARCDLIVYIIGGFAGSYESAEDLGT
jgi:hypothetical protein